MHFDYLIIGQGISGTWLSYYLQKEARSFLVIDNNTPHSSSRIAAGIINPVTGRRHVTVWMAEKIIPHAWEAYNVIGRELGITAISKKDIIDFFPNPQMRESFLQRIRENANYVASYPDESHFNHLFRYEFGCGEISPVFIAHLELLLPAWRSYLLTRKSLIEEDFDITQLKIEPGGIQYKNIRAGKIIFCEGHAATSNPFFKLLPFAPNKGEALLVEIAGLSTDHIYKKGVMLVPLASKDMYWVGSDYAWSFDNADPTQTFRQSTEKHLNNWLKMPVKIIDHVAGIRPATLERRPFAGMHPLQKTIGILNGMGTKGCSLAPYFAYQFARHLLYNDPLDPAADIGRFRNILSRDLGSIS